LLAAHEAVRQFGPRRRSSSSTRGSPRTLVPRRPMRHVPAWCAEPRRWPGSTTPHRRDPWRRRALGGGVAGDGARRGWDALGVDLDEADPGRFYVQDAGGGPAGAERPSSAQPLPG